MPGKAQDFASILLSAPLRTLSPCGFQSAAKGHYCSSSPLSCSFPREKQTNCIHLRNEEPEIKMFLLSRVQQPLMFLDPSPGPARTRLTSPVCCLIWVARAKVAAWLPFKLVSAHGTHIHSSEQEFPCVKQGKGAIAIKLSKRLLCAWGAGSHPVFEICRVHWGRHSSSSSCVSKLFLKGSTSSESSPPSQQV